MLEKDCKVVFKASKCWQGTKQTGLSEFVVWQLAATRELKKYIKNVHITFDVRQQSAGLALSLKRPAILDRLGEKGGKDDRLFHGAFALLLRKYGVDTVVTGIFEDLVTKDIWIPLYKSDIRSRSEASHMFILFKMSKPPELQLISAQKMVLIRTTCQGVFTKLKKYEDNFPNISDETRFKDKLPDMVREVENTLQREANEELEIEKTAEDETKNIDSSISEVQKILRQKLTRKLKTIKKAYEKINRDTPDQKDVERMRRDAEILKNYLYRVHEEDEVLHLKKEEVGLEEDISIELDSFKSPGENLDRYFKMAKRMKRGYDLGVARSKSTKHEIEILQYDVDQLKNSNLSQKDVTNLAQKYKIFLDSERMVRGKTGTMQELAKGFRVFGGYEGALIHVGKSAKDNDDLCKQAKSNDFWFHAVNGKGSHIIIPSQSIKNKEKTCPEPLKREAAILALHFSNMTHDRRGEVYFSKRHLIKKKKGMPPGLWQVDKAETLNITYSADDLQNILGKESRYI